MSAKKKIAPETSLTPTSSPAPAPDPIRTAVAEFGKAETDAADRLEYFRGILNGATKEAEKAKK
jgi:hypothetical protein